MISEAAVISNPVSRGTPKPLPPRPTTTFRKARSFMSNTRFQATVRGSMPSVRDLLCKLLSINAASRLCAFSIAAKSPVKCKLISSIGSTCDQPPPAAPPLMPNTGPNEGSRRTTVVCLPIRFMPCVKPIDIVVLPSPAGVGEMAETKISLASATFLSSIRESGSFAFDLP